MWVKLLTTDKRLVNLFCDNLMDIWRSYFTHLTLRFLFPVQIQQQIQASNILRSLRRTDSSKRCTMKFLSIATESDTKLLLSFRNQLLTRSSRAEVVVIAFDVRADDTALHEIYGSMRDPFRYR